MEWRAFALSQNLRPGETMPEYVARGAETIGGNVDQIARLASNSDAFDVLELLRMYESPHSLNGYRESVNQKLPAAVELVALVLLGRGRRVTSAFRAPDVNPGEFTPKLHRLADELIKLGQLQLITDGRSDKHGPLTQLASTYVNHSVSTRSMQFEHISDCRLADLFSSVHLGSVLLDVLGFTYEDFRSVREAIQVLRTQRLNAERDAAIRARDLDPEGSSLESAIQAKDLAAPIMRLLVRPGNRACFTVADLAKRVTVPEERISRILATFSVTMSGNLDPVAEVKKFLTGSGQFRNAALVDDGNGNFITLNVPIGTDCFQRVAETHIKPHQKLWKRYLGRRTQVSEQLALNYVSTLLEQPQYEANLKYFRPDPDVDPALLGPGALDPSAFGDPAESDGLFIIEDVAICVEVKGGRVSDQARGGGVKRLSADLRETVGKATDQALRLENLIRENGGL